MVKLLNKYYSRCLFFDRYNNISIIFCSIVLIVLFLVFLLFSIFIKISFSKSYSGFVVKEDDFYVRVFLSDSEIQFLQNNELVVNGNIVSYDVISISDEYILSDELVREVIISFDLSDKDKIVNNVIELNFLEKNTIFNKVKEMFL